MNSFKALLSDLQARFQALTQRERVLVSVAAAAVSAFLLFILIFSFSSSASGYRRRTADKLDKLQEAQALAATYAEAERTRQETERQLGANAIQLISYLSEKGNSAQLDIPTMNPKGDVAIGDGKIIESSVELTLTDIPIRKLYAFLSDIERGPGLVKVKFLRIEPRPSNDTLTAWITVATYRMKG